MKIEIDIPDGQIGEWKIETFEVTKKQADVYNLRAIIHRDPRTIEPGTYKRLVHKGHVVMSNTPSEIRDLRFFINRAKSEGGHILINGLGLGVALKAILESDKIKTITVIEKSSEVITLIAPYYKDDKRITIIQADALTWKAPQGMKYNIVWHDIWNDITSDNLPAMKKLHRRYGKRAKWQGSWCRELCERY